MLAKKHIGLRTSKAPLVSKAYQARLKVAWVNAGRKGGLHVISIYCWTAEGMTERNKGLLTEVQRVTKLLKGPWVLGGDFNMTPTSLEEWAKQNRGTIRNNLSNTVGPNVPQHPDDSHQLSPGDGLI